MRASSPIHPALSHPPGGLVGRDAERLAVAELVRAARLGAGGALVVHGAPGTGRSALLDAATGQAAGFQNLAAGGSAAESDLPGAGLHRLLRPLADRVDALGRTHAAAIRLALGDGVTAGADRPDRLVLGAAVLELLAAAAGDSPLLCRIDDADQLDPSSRDALTFAGRRLAGERVAMLFAVTGPPPGGQAFAGLPGLTLDPLDDAASRGLLVDLLAGPLPEGPPDDLVAALLGQARGNPLALIELVGALSPGQLHGIDPPPERLPAGSRLRRRHEELVARLPPDCRRLVLIAAAAERLEVDTLLRAMAAAGLDDTALEAAESAGLLRLGGDTGGDTGGDLVRLSDPLLRESVYSGATLSDRRAAHRLLVGVLDRERQRPDRAWHRAAAADGPSDELADELREAAVVAGRAGDHAASSRSMQRSAALAVAPGAAAERLVAAARSAWLAGDSRRARILLDQARPLAGTAELRGMVDLLHGEIELRSGTAEQAYDALGAVTEGLAGPQRTQAVTALMRASEVSMLAGDHSRFLDMARRIEALRRPDEPPVTRLMFEHFAGLAAAFRGHHHQAAGPLRQVVDLAPLTHDPVALILATIAAMTLGDEARGRALAERAVAEARAQRATAHLPVALEFLAFAEFWSDHYAAASTHSLEGLRLARQAGQDNCVAAHLAILALLSTLQGDRDTAVLRARVAARQATGRGLTRPGALTTWAVARVALANRDPNESAAALRAVEAAGPRGMHLTIQVIATPDLVEAAVRLGNRGWAAGTLSTFEQWASDTRSPAMLALAARSHALLATNPGEAEEWFGQALLLHGHRGLEFERARTQLLYGRALRRRRRPARAREQLRDALAVFELLDAVPWSEQTRAELRAAGGSTKPRPTRAVDDLTAQQAQIAHLVIGGATNREIAARLFISPRTVDHHLRNIFAKLGVRSRVELTRLLT